MTAWFSSFASGSSGRPSEAVSTADERAIGTSVCAGGIFDGLASNQLAGPNSSR